jgi:hypothetical protein
VSSSESGSSKGESVGVVERAPEMDKEEPLGWDVLDEAAGGAAEAIFSSCWWCGASEGESEPSSAGRVDELQRETN